MVKKKMSMTQLESGIQSRVLDDVRGEFSGEFHMYMRFHTSWRGGRTGKEAGFRGYFALESE